MKAFKVILIVLFVLSALRSLSDNKTEGYLMAGFSMALSGVLFIAINYLGL